MRRSRLAVVLLLVLAAYHFAHGSAASTPNVPDDVSAAGQGQAADISRTYEDWGGMSVMELEAAAIAAAKHSGESETSIRRNLRNRDGLGPLASAWHNLLVAQLLSKSTSCGGTLTQACRALQMADSLVKSGKLAGAAQQMKQATSLALGCAKSVPASAAHHIRVAIPLIIAGQKALFAGGTRSVTGAPSSGKRKKGGHKWKDTPKTAGRRKGGHKWKNVPVKTNRVKGGHKWKNVPSKTNRVKGGHKWKNVPSKTNRVKGGHKYKRGARRTGSRKSGTSSKAPATKSGGMGWLGHNDLPQAVMQWLPYGNPIDDCWMGPNWQADRTQLAKCVQGYAAGTTGGAKGRVYHVTTNLDDRISPKPGSLRYGATRAEPLWIVFDDDFDFSGLDAEIIVYNDKTIDARGRKVTMGNGPCMAIEYSHNVIVHGMTFKNCKNRIGPIQLMTGPDNHVSGRTYLNGYGLYIYASKNVWVDHCSFDYADDTHIDIVAASTAVTVSNSYFTNQDKVILMGHNDSYTADVHMRVTVMLNKFGPGLSERLPRGRFGKFHVLNNYYPNGWNIYAIGGSANPTFLSEGNFFVANDRPFLKEVTKHNIAAGQSTFKDWDWQSVGDHFENGAFFTESGSPGYKPMYPYKALNALEVPRATARAGPIGQ